MAEKEYIELEAIEVLAKDRLSSYHDKLVMELLLGNDITANAAKQRFDTVREVFDLVKSIFPADVQEVRHGNWEQCFEDCRKQIEGDKCSVCNFEHYGTSIRHYHYCPNCGAKMDEE